jgi:hypothetical protein
MDECAGLPEWPRLAKLRPWRGRLTGHVEVAPGDNVNVLIPRGLLRPYLDPVRPLARVAREFPPRRAATNAAVAFRENPDSRMIMHIAGEPFVVVEDRDFR